VAKRDPRVDAYIEQAAPFAKPILKHLRRIVHIGCPAAEESIKWQFPHFDYKGTMCGMAAFKSHCSFGFWKAELIFGSRRKEQEAMGQFGRITSLSDLPPEKRLIGYVRKAAQLNGAGVKRRRADQRTRIKKSLTVPEDFKSALQRNAKARKTFESFSYTNRKEYVNWITDAKRQDTRSQRLKTSMQWLAEGKPHNWKYMPKWR
jgi:uncharacterized protein YdeI (YjbR/CyaY-like superfamily)